MELMIVVLYKICAPFYLDGHRSRSASAQPR